MFSIGVVLLQFGYSCVYTGIANLMNGGNGPTLFASLGVPWEVAGPGADKAQPPGPSIQAPGPSTGTVPFPGI